MKVHELIEKLQECDPDATVIRTSDNFELNGANIKASGVYNTKTGSKNLKHFTDAFDYTQYTKETWSLIGGEESVVNIF